MEYSEELNDKVVLEDASLLKYVANLSPEDIDKLVAIAKNMPEDIAGRSKSMTDYMNLVDSVFKSTNFNSVGNTPQTRNQRYEIYDEMDESTAYISSALDILSDDATQADSDGVVIHVKSGSEKVKNLVEEFIEEYELVDKVSKWARAIAKYGDLFIQVRGEMGTGISYINDTIYPSRVDRKDLNGKLVAFADNQDTAYTVESLYAPWEFVHFRHKGDIYKSEAANNRLNTLENTYDQNLTSAYGQSILRPAIKVYAQLRFVENMILLSRLTNSIRRNIFLINVGDVAPDKAYDTIQNYARLLKKDINLNIESNMYSSAKHTVNYDEDIFIPVGDPQNDVRIESVGGDANMKEQYDLEYLLNKLFSAIKVPKAYLNYEQDLNARATLIQLDVRYARSVGQLQTTVISGIRRLVNIHLAYLGLNPDELDLDISLTAVSAIDEEARAEQQQRQIDNARNIWDLTLAMNESMSMDESAEGMNMNAISEYLMSDYLGFDNNLINKVFNRTPAEESAMSRVNSHRIYKITDSQAMYPSHANFSDYQRLRESIIQEQNTQEH